jgi:hypothetical protein
MNQVLRFHSLYLVHPFRPLHICKPCRDKHKASIINKKTNLDLELKKSQFSLSSIDLVLKRGQIEGDERFVEHDYTFCGVLFQPNKSKNLSPIFCTIFRVLDLKTLKIGRGGTRRKKGSAAFIVDE